MNVRDSLDRGHEERQKTWWIVLTGNALDFEGDDGQLH